MLPLRHVSDCIVDPDAVCVSIFVVDSERGEALPPTVGSDERPRHRPPHVLDFDIHIGKFGFPEPRTKELVVQTDKVSYLVITVFDSNAVFSISARRIR